jgi:GWxTD domain-containing protein
MDSHQRVSRLKKFFVYRAADFQPAEKTAAEPTLEDRLRSPEYQVYDTMTEAELDAEFDGASYIATSEDKKVFQGLDLAGKRQFLKRFWLLRDQNPGTPENEFRQEYLRRLQYVNRHFGTGKPGWKSDRGRIYLVYGKPDEVERFPSSGESRAYEVWHYYHIQGGVLFVFVDVRGFGDYILVHSTARNELHDENWERWIYVQ